MNFKYDDRTLRVFTEQTLPDEGRKAMLRAVASETSRVRAEQTARSGGIAPQLADMVVDGKRGAGPAQIGHNSRVLLDWHYLKEAAIVCRDELLKAGPVVSGDWRKSILCLVGGAPMDPRAIPRTADHVAVVVTVPYARRLEVGRANDGSAFVVQVEQHFVERTAIRLRSRHGDIARWSFGYSDLANAHALTARWQHKRQFWEGGGFRKWGSFRSEPNVRYPTIHIDEIEAA